MKFFITCLVLLISIRVSGIEPCDFPIHHGRVCPDDEAEMNVAMKWFYNREVDRCLKLRYHGCGGNANRFSSKQHCVELCVDPCGKPVDLGVDCTNDQGVNHDYYPKLQWFFNVSANKCLRFQYTGCGGNGNRFHSMDKCKDKCIAE